MTQPQEEKNTYFESHLENEDSFYYNNTWKETWERCWWRWSYLLWFKVWCISSSRNRPRFFLNQIRWRGLTVSVQRGLSASAGFWRFFRVFLPVARYLLPLTGLLLFLLFLLLLHKMRQQQQQLHHNYHLRDTYMIYMIWHCFWFFFFLFFSFRISFRLFRYTSS